MDIRHRQVDEQDDDLDTLDSVEPGFHPSTTATPVKTMSFAQAPKRHYDDVLAQCLGSAPGIGGPKS